MKSGDYPSLAVALSDQNRSKVLYSPFRPRSLNPDHYDEKMKFWMGTINEYVTANNKVCFTLEDMEKAFMSGSQKPQCLPQVLLNLNREGKAVRKDSFFANLSTDAEQSTWLSWSVNQFKRAANKIWVFVPDNKIEWDTPVVYIPQLELQERRILETSELCNKLRGLEEWKTLVKQKLGIQEDLDLIVEYMRVTGKLMIDVIGPTEIIKVPNQSQAKNISQTKNISLVEKSKYDLNRTIEILQSDLESIHLKIYDSENQAREALRAGKRNTAKCHLRTRKVSEKRAEKLTAILDNLGAIAIQVEDATTDARVLDAYESGKKILDNIFAENGLSSDRVSDAMLSVQEVLDKQEDISNTLSKQLVEDDVAGLERELEELMEEEHATQLKNKAAEARNKEIEMEANLLAKLVGLCVEEKEPEWPKETAVSKPVTE